MTPERIGNAIEATAITLVLLVVGATLVGIAIVVPSTLIAYAVVGAIFAGWWRYFRDMSRRH